VLGLVETPRVQPLAQSVLSQTGADVVLGDVLHDFYLGE